MRLARWIRQLAGGEGTVMCRDARGHAWEEAAEEVRKREELHRRMSVAGKLARRECY